MHELQAACCIACAAWLLRAALAYTSPCSSNGTAPSSPLSPSPFPICRQEPSQAVRRFFVLQQAKAAMLLSSSFLKLLCPRCQSRQDRSQPPRPWLVAPRRSLHRARSAAAAWSCRAGQPRPDHGVIRPAASTPRRPVHLNLGLLLADEQPATSPVTPPTAAAVSCVQRPEEEEEGVNRK